MNIKNTHARHARTSLLFLFCLSFKGHSGASIQGAESFFSSVIVASMSLLSTYVGINNREKALKISTLKEHNNTLLCQEKSVQEALNSVFSQTRSISREVTIKLEKGSLFNRRWLASDVTILSNIKKYSNAILDKEKTINKHMHNIFSMEGKVRKNQEEITKIKRQIAFNSLLSSFLLGFFIGCYGGDLSAEAIMLGLSTGVFSLGSSTLSTHVLWYLGASKEVKESTKIIVALLASYGCLYAIREYRQRKSEIK